MDKGHYVERRKDGTRETRVRKERSMGEDVENEERSRAQER